MVKRYKENPSLYLGIAETYDPTLAANLELYEKPDEYRNPEAVSHMLYHQTLLTDLTWKNYIQLNAPIKKDQQTGEYYSDSVTSFKHENTYYLLLQGTPVMDPEGQDDKHNRNKHRALLDRIAEKTEDMDFWSLYNGNTETYEKDVHKARWGLLGVLCKWTNFDVEQTKELFEGSWLYHPGWNVVNKDGMTTSEQVIRKILHDRPIFHKNEIEGFIRLHYELRFNEVTGKPEISTNGSYKELEDFQFNSLHRHILNKGGTITAQALRQLLTSDFVERYHPFEAYFNGLPSYDQSSDPIAELTAKVETTNQEY